MEKRTRRRGKCEADKKKRGGWGGVVGKWIALRLGKQLFSFVYIWLGKLWEYGLGPKAPRGLGRQLITPADIKKKEYFFYLLPFEIAESYTLCSWGNEFTYKLPRDCCSNSKASKRARKLPTPKPWWPRRWMISKKRVGRAVTGRVKSWSK